MATISLCMIVKNEEETMERCLSCVSKIVDEMIVVDTGSVDCTKEIAAKAGAKVFDFLWKDDFAAARNYAFSLAKSDYCMWLDADDTINEENQLKLKEWKEKIDVQQPDVVMMPYDVSFDESGNPTFSYFRERIIRNTGHPLWEGRVHEVITPWGKIAYGDVHIEHRKIKAYDTERNLRIYEKMLSEGCLLTAREQFYYGRELYYHNRNQEAIEILQSFMENPDGWVENKLEACRQLSECYGRVGNDEKQLESLYRTFLLDLPRAETCCAIGRIYFDKGQWTNAAFWYETALRTEKRKQGGGFIREDCYGYLPCIQLCVCYDRLGEREKAESYNEMAAIWKPDSPAVAYNRAYFQSGKEA